MKTSLAFVTAVLLAALLIGCAAGPNNVATEPNDFPPRPTNTPIAPGPAPIVLPSATSQPDATSSSGDTPQTGVTVSTVAPPAPPTEIVGSSGSADANPNAPTLSPVPPRAGGSGDVTMADNGGTITLTVGQSFLLKLNPDMKWNVTVADPTVLTQAQTFVAIPGAQGMFVAQKPGQTAFSAVGTAICNPGEMCPMFAILFKVTIVVK